MAFARRRGVGLRISPRTSTVEVPRGRQEQPVVVWQRQSIPGLELGHFTVTECVPARVWHPGRTAHATLLKIGKAWLGDCVPEGFRHAPQPPKEGWQGPWWFHCAGALRSRTSYARERP